MDDTLLKFNITKTSDNGFKKFYLVLSILAPDNSKFFCFPLKVRVIESLLYTSYQLHYSKR